ncbi:MAG: hypothetical protein ABJZ55_13845 [Fuerstiella sp.]
MTDNVLQESRTVSGSKVVIAMFGLGILSTAALWVYWTKHLEPFMPMQIALNEKFEGASTRIDGGQRKLHQGTPSVLSVRMKIPFDPNETANDLRVQEIANTCVELSKIHVADMQFDEIVVLLYHQVKEKGASQRKVSLMLNAESAGEQWPTPPKLDTSDK